MKKSFFILFVGLTFLITGQLQAQDHFSTEIGKAVDGKLVMTANTKELITNWEKSLLTNSKIKVVFEGLELIKEDGYYLMLATSQDKKTKSAVELVLNNGKLYQARVGTGGGGVGGVTVTCTGCTIGCTPRKVGTLWECQLPCAECVKSETVVE